MKESNLVKLTSARDKVAEVYNDQATDDEPDNGNLTALNQILLLINSVMKKFKE